MSEQPVSEEFQRAYAAGRRDANTIALANLHDEVNKLRTTIMVAIVTIYVVLAVLLRGGVAV